MNEQFSFLQVAAERKRIEGARIDKVAMVMWQEESLRECGRARPVSWEEETPSTQEKWRALARVGLIAAMLFDRGRL